MHVEEQGTVTGVATDGDLWVAVGWSGTDGAILTSPDGSNWTKRVSGVGQGLQSVATDGQVWVAVGWNGAIITSRDGISWERQLSGTSSFLNFVVSR